MQTKNMIEIEDILTIFFETTNVPLKYIDKNGDVIKINNKTERFCEFFEKHGKNLKSCTITHLNAGKQAYELGETYIFFCPAGLVEFAYPLMDGEHFLGTFIGGPVNMAIPSEKFVDKIIIENNLELKYKQKLLLDILEVSLVDTTKVRYLSKLLGIIVEETFRETSILIKKNYDDKQKEMEINNLFTEIKNHKNDRYPYEKEKELCEKIKIGDLKEAKFILNELLGYILSTHGNSIKIRKTRIFELCSILSRAVIEGGGDLTKIFGINSHYLNKLYNLNSIEEISLWLTELLNNFNEVILESQNLSQMCNGNKLKETLLFIKKNYKYKISQDSVAQQVGISTKYLSSLFQKNISTSFTSYINELRIEEAKNLLKYTDRTLFDIAISIGFEDASYFSKVFKKIIGVSPNQYRKNVKY